MEKKVNKKIEFSEDEKKALYQILWRTWVTLAPDIFACDEVKALPRDSVIETVLDASYLETNSGQLMGKPAKTPDQKLIKRFRELSYEGQIKFCMDNVFKNRTYS